MGSTSRQDSPSLGAAAGAAYPRPGNIQAVYMQGGRTTSRREATWASTVASVKAIGGWTAKPAASLLPNAPAGVTGLDVGDGGAAAKRGVCFGVCAMSWSASGEAEAGSEPNSMIFPEDLTRCGDAERVVRYEVCVRLVCCRNQLLFRWQKPARGWWFLSLGQSVRSVLMRPGVKVGPGFKGGAEGSLWKYVLQQVQGWLVGVFAFVGGWRLEGENSNSSKYHRCE